MSKTIIYTSLLSLVAGAMVFSSGCIGLPGPSLGPASVPVPVPSYLQDQYEDKAFEKERYNYNKTVILAPIPPGTEHIALDTPSDDEVIRALEKARKTQGGIPFLETRERTNVKIVKEKIAD